MKYLVQPSEPKEFKEYLSRENIPFEEEHDLQFDYFLEGANICVERKTAEDFVGSIVDGRIWKQLHAMSTVCRIPVLAVIGSPSVALTFTRFRRSSYLGALASIIIKTSGEGLSSNVSVVVLDTNYDLMYILKSLYEKAREGSTYLVPVQPAKKSDTTASKIALLTAIPGVGEVYAKRLLEKFKTIEKIVNASISELQEVLGKKRAEKVYKFFKE